MRTFLFSAAAAASALALAAPASAQWYPQPQGYAHGYHNPYNYAAAQRMDMRAERLRRNVFNNYQRGLLSPGQAGNLDRAAVLLKQRIWRASRNGLSRSEVRSLNRGLNRLERRVRAQVSQNARYRRYAPRYAYGYRW